MKDTCAFVRFACRYTLAPRKSVTLYIYLSSIYIARLVVLVISESNGKRNEGSTEPKQRFIAKSRVVSGINLIYPHLDSLFVLHLARDETIDVKHFVTMVQYILESSVYPNEPEPLKELRAVTASHPR